MTIDLREVLIPLPVAVPSPGILLCDLRRMRMLRQNRASQSPHRGFSYVTARSQTPCASTDTGTACAKRLQEPRQPHPSEGSDALPTKGLKTREPPGETASSCRSSMALTRVTRLPTRTASLPERTTATL